MPFIETAVVERGIDNWLKARQADYGHSPILAEVVEALRDELKECIDTGELPWEVLIREEHPELT